MSTFSRPVPNDRPADRFLLRHVPTGARRILDVGCGTGALGAELKRQNPAREIIGVERIATFAARAARNLDQVYLIDIAREELPLESASFDCILFPEILTQLDDPESLLRQYRRLLAPSGTILCSIPNVQHHSLLKALCTGDWQYAENGLLDHRHLRFFSRSTCVKMLLDAGFSPDLLELVTQPCDTKLLHDLEPVIRRFHLDGNRVAKNLNAARYVFRGSPLSGCEEDPPSPYQGDPRNEVPLTFVACVSDQDTLHANLLSSPCLRPGSPHEVLLMANCPNAAAGLNAGIAKARHPWVVCLHQDVYLPIGWPTRFRRQIELATERLGRIGVAGVFGCKGRGTTRQLVGHVVHQERLLHAGDLPAPVDTLDELLLAVPRQSTQRFDPTLGFHFYGADLCLEAHKVGLAVAAIDAPCSHNTRSNWYPPGFKESGAAFARKWAAQLPCDTPCIHVEAGGALRIPGDNSTGFL